MWLVLKRTFGYVLVGQTRTLLGLGSLLGLLGQKDGLDVGQHSALGNGDTAEQFVELLVVAHSQLQVTGDDTSLLVVAGSVTGQLQDLSGQILEHSGQIDRCTSSHTLGVVALAEKPVHTAHGELEPSAG